jgi:UDP-N-acetylmuramoyl-tripeptide--D-alanyl-D-alanine ligase
MTNLFSADELAHATGGVMTSPFHATGISIDTRTLQPGDLFVALKTSSGDGHAHVGDALHHGAAGALVHTTDAMPDGAKLLVVGDTLTALTALGAAGRERFQGSVVAVTGSVGKTTTKEMLRTVLGACGATHAAHASYNNHWGVPLTLARLPEDAAYAVIEIGMNHPGEIAPLAKLAGPDVAVITTVEAAHIGHLGSLDAIADEKASIMQGILSGGTAVLPSDNAHIGRLRACLPQGVHLTEFGMRDVRQVTHDADGSDVTAVIAGIELSFRISAPGAHMVRNALATLHAAHALGADVRLCAAALGGFSPVSGRGVRAPLLGGAATLLDESYNASAASVRAALEVLRLQPAQRRIAVLGDMLELGAHTEEQHKGLAPAVNDSADLLYACGPGMKFLYDAILPEKRGAHTPTSADLAPAVASAIRPGDTVLIKGSLGSRMRLIVETLERVAG